MPQQTENTKTNIHFRKPEQVKAMRDAAYQGRHGQRDDAIVTTLYDTGLKRKKLSKYLSTRDDDGPALFPSRKSERMTGKAVNDVVKRLADRVEVRPYTYTGRGESADMSAHTLRHSVAYRMLHSYDGYTLYDMRNRLRHSRLATTERNYDHFQTI